MRIEEGVGDIDTNNAIGIEILKCGDFSLSNGLIAIELPDDGAAGTWTVIRNSKGEVGVTKTVLRGLKGKTAKLAEGESVTTKDLNKGVVVINIEIAKGSNGWIRCCGDGVSKGLIAFTYSWWIIKGVEPEGDQAWIFISDEGREVTIRSNAEGRLIDRLDVWQADGGSEGIYCYSINCPKVIT